MITSKITFCTNNCYIKMSGETDINETETNEARNEKMANDNMAKTCENSLHDQLDTLTNVTNNQSSMLPTSEKILNNIKTNAYTNIDIYDKNVDHGLNILTESLTNSPDSGTNRKINENETNHPNTTHVMIDISSYKPGDGTNDMDATSTEHSLSTSSIDNETYHNDNATTITTSIAQNESISRIENLKQASKNKSGNKRSKSPLESGQNSSSSDDDDYGKKATRKASSKGYKGQGSQQPEVIVVYQSGPAPQGYPSQGYSHSQQGSQQPQQIIVVQQPPPPSGYYAQPQQQDTVVVVPPGWENPFQEDPLARQQFIAKTYMILMVDLLVLFGFISLATFAPGGREFVAKHWVPIFLPCFFLFLLTIVVSCCCQEWMMFPPGDKIMNVITVIAFSGVLVVISTFLPYMSVTLAMGTTMVCFLVLTIVAHCSKIDFTKWYVPVGVVLLVLVLFSFIVPVFMHAMDDAEIKWTNFAVAVAFSVVMCLYILMDTQIMMSGKSVHLTTEMHWFAATKIFGDIALLFWMLLQVFVIGGNS